MKVSKAFGHIAIVVWCCLLTVLAETSPSSIQQHQQQQQQLQLQQSSMPRQQQPQQQQQQQHFNHHTRHNQHHKHNHQHHLHHHHHREQPQQQQHQNQHHHQPQQRSHSTKLLRHHPTTTTTATSITSTAMGTNTYPRQSRKLETKSLTSQVELIDVKSAGSTSTSSNHITPHNDTATVTGTATSTGNAIATTTSTKLRRLNDEEFYNRVPPQRRYNTRRNARDEWAYNTYNIHTNTYGSSLPSSHASGKGDDNSDDVEFVSATGSRMHPDWSRRGGYVPPRRSTTTTTTKAPPAIVPARRGYPMAPPTEAPASEDPLETNVISRNPAVGNMDPKDMEKRHICVQQRTITMPVKTTEVYSRPIWKHVSIPCQPQNHANQMCTRVQLVHEQAYRDVIRHKSAQQVTYDCCTGWMRESQHADGCMKPICTARCQNGGTCSGPDSCSCPAGFSGRYCEQDINECKEEKPCDQTCINTVGSYYCKCRDGFQLQADQQSCRKNDVHQDDAFEARDLENEIETQEDFTARLQKIEKQLANERVQSNELHKTLQSTYTMVDSLKNRLVNLEKQQMDYNRLQTNLYKTETRTMKLEGMLNLLMKCRNTNGPTAQCP